VYLNPLGLHRRGRVCYLEALHQRVPARQRDRDVIRDVAHRQIPLDDVVTLALYPNPIITRKQRRQRERSRRV
jgi:hypothetical protein